MEYISERESEMNFERLEHVLSTIDRLGVASVGQLHEILKLGSYRYTCMIINQLEEYLNVIRSRQKIVYLNKKGLDLIGSDGEVKKTALLDHMLLLNDVYLYFNCPLDWKREYVIETQEKAISELKIKIEGLTIAKKKIVPDAIFKRNGYVYLIEVDNTRKMVDNRKKIERYKDMWKEIKEHFGVRPKLCIYTHSEKRKKEFIKLCSGLNHEVLTFKEI